MRADPHQDYTFRLFGSPDTLTPPITWTGPPVSQMWQDSDLRENAYLMSKARASVGLNADAESFLAQIFARQTRDLTGGRTTASVRQENTPFCEVNGPAGLTLLLNRQSVVIKDQGATLNDREYTIHQALYQRRVPVPHIMQPEQGRELYIEHLGEDIETALARSGYYGGEFERTRGWLGNSLITSYQQQAGPLVAQVDTAIAAILGSELKRELIDEAIIRVVKGTRVSRLQARFNYHALRLAQTIPWGTKQDLAALDEIAQNLDEATQKFPCWTGNVFPKNMYGLDEGKNGNPQYKIKVSDFNGIQRSSMQEAIARVIDGYLPIRLGGYNQMMVTLHEEDKKQEMVELYLREWEHQTGTIIDREDFARYLPFARFAVNLRGANYALRELAQATTFQDIFIKYKEEEHHRATAQKVLATVSTQGKFIPVAQLVFDRYEAALNAIPDRVWEQAVRWDAGEMKE
ncbi:hypothetical protein HYV86_07260 [Candidatus Woesearchaeota archaeon]|nr:hypothetical protein [Candidatus Woesearchaeota archaeon]